MAEVKWIKITTDMLDDEKMKIIDTMQKRDLIHHIWISLLIYAGRTNDKGLIHISEGKGYSNDMLVVILRRPKKDIDYALNVLKELELIKVDDNNVIEVINFIKHQSIQGMERARELTKKRVKRYREKKKLEEESKNETEDVALGNVTVTQNNNKEKEKENKKRNKSKCINKTKYYSDDEKTVYISDVLENGGVKDRKYSRKVRSHLQEEHSEAEGGGKFDEEELI